VSMRIILRGGPFTGEVHSVSPGRKVFHALAKTDQWAFYEATGQADLETGLPIFVYQLPGQDRPPFETRPRSGGR
jgi:hypothetical protein